MERPSVGGLRTSPDWWTVQERSLGEGDGSRSSVWRPFPPSKRPSEETTPVIDTRVLDREVGMSQAQVGTYGWYLGLPSTESLFFQGSTRLFNSRQRGKKPQASHSHPTKRKHTCYGKVWARGVTAAKKQVRIWNQVWFTLSLVIFL